VLGPLTGDHFYVYVADKCVRPSYECHDRVLNIMVRTIPCRAVFLCTHAEVDLGVGVCACVL
jgi:hypothetical protein